MRVEVTAKDIAEAQADTRKMPAAYCPIARALNRELGTKPEAELYVYGEHVDIGGDRYALPREARRFVDRFDAEQPVEPIAFEIDTDSPIEVDEDGEPC